MSHNQFHSKRRQLAHLSAHIRSLASNWSELSATYRNRLTALLNRLIGELKPFVPLREMKQLLAGVTLLIGIGGVQDTQAQSFAPPVGNLFGFSISGITVPELADIDDDGDLDLFFNNYNLGFGFDILFAENTGSAASPTWGAVQTNPFGLPGTVAYTIGQRLVDIDGDGDLDLFTSSENSGGGGSTLTFYENTGTPTSPQFGPPQTAPFGIPPSTGTDAQVPEFGDVDLDGDYDLIILDGDSYGYFLRFVENTGTANAPAFVAVQPNPFSGLNPVPGSYYFPTLGDLDYDGDLDMIMGNVYSADLSFHENTGTSQAPIWDLTGVTNPFGLQGVDTIAIPVLVDMDSDGDLDLVTGGYYDGLSFHENLDFATGVVENSSSSVQVYPNPASEIVTVALGELTDAEVRIMDMQGKETRSWSDQNGTIELDLDDLATGVYTISVSSKGAILTERLVVR